MGIHECGVCGRWEGNSMGACWGNYRLDTRTGSWQECAHRVKQILINIAVTVAWCIGGVVALLGYLSFTSRPPEEAKLLKSFYDRRAAYERLRDMLQADGQIESLAEWGVATTKSIVHHVPPEGDFPVERYQEYMALLKEVGGYIAFRGEGEPADLSIGVWRWGALDHSRHVGICWKDEEPPNQVATIDGYRGHIRVFRHIDSSWYLWADM